MKLSLSRPDGTMNWRLVAIIVVGYIVLLRIVFSGVIDLIPEEAYYWNYAQHADIGYLDHPPMVAWLIWLSTALFGHNEMAVRLPALLSWVVAAFFIFRLSVNLFDRATGYRGLILLAALPVYFSIGCLMTPDAPLYATWAAALYFFERALIEGKRMAWLGVGVSLGLGMISKYTIALLGPSALVFIVLDKQSRRVLLRPEPYLAVLVSVALFSPVLIWNAHHEWASFVFQGPRRWSGGLTFSPHLLLGGALVLLTPIGLINAVNVMVQRRAAATVQMSGASGKRERLFMLVFTLVPLAVFLTNSLHNAPKLNWTGPIWLVLIPLMAWKMTARAGEKTGWWYRLWRKAWMPTIGVMMALYTAGFVYLLLGAPGVPVETEMALPVAWREVGERVEQIEHAVQKETGSEPLIVGMDRYWITSQLSFYDGVDNDTDQEFAGRHLVGEKSLMWDTWMPRTEARGRNVVLIDFDRENLQKGGLAEYFDRMGDVVSEPIVKYGRVIGYFHWRVGYGYKG